MGRTVAKLKYNEVKGLREKLWNKNNKICPICKEEIAPEEAALDHCHKTGHIRNTIHKDCNILLGKIENYVGRYGKRFRDLDVLFEFCANVVGYMDSDYSDNPYHPTHRTPEDKIVRAWRKRMKSAKTDKTKKKYDDLIKEFKRAKK